MPLVQTEPKKIYIRVEAQPITTAGIYHNSDLGLISLSSDGSNWLTIADKNLGATSTDITSTDSYGYYYQWGNNYGFPTTGSVSYGKQVNASSYGPGNYYSSSNRVQQLEWDSSLNANLRGNTTDTLAARRGPCDEGYHIPSSTEVGTLYNIGVSLGARDANSASDMRQYLKMPAAGRRYYSGATLSWQGSYGIYWTSTRYSCIWMNNPEIYCPRSQNSDYCAPGEGHSIRPFKNEAVQPDDSRTVLYQ